MKDTNYTNERHEAFITVLKIIVNDFESKMHDNKQTKFTIDWDLNTEANELSVGHEHVSLHYEF